MSGTVYDAVVVGGGPAGASCAIALAERGARVTLLDKARFPRVKPCAEYINPEALAVLERLGLLADVRAAGAAVFHGMRLVAPGGRELDLDFAGDSGRYALGLSRHRLDLLAIERCRAVGVEVVEGAHVRGVLVEHGVVLGVRATQRGVSRETRGRVVVGADGRHSAVARALALDMPLRWPRRIGLAAHLEGFELTGSLGEMHVSSGGYCGVAPQEEGRVNVAMVVDLARFERRGCSVEAFFDRELRGYPGLSTHVERYRRVTPVRGVGPLAHRARRAAGAGYLLAGDAAGFFDPFTGEGIFDALRGGELAAATVAEALERGDFSARSLEIYAARRRAAFASKRRAARLVQAFVCSPRLLDYAVARIASRPPVAATMTGVLGDYRDAGVVLSPRFLWAALRP